MRGGDRKALGPLVVAALLASCTPPASPSPAPAPRVDVEGFERDAREGMARLNAKDFLTAAARFERALAANPGDDQMLYLVALARVRARDTRGALDALGRLARSGSDLVPLERHFADLAALPDFESAVAATRASAARHRAGVEAFRIPERGLVPEGIAYDPGGRAFYVGSIHLRKIVKITVGAPPVDFVAPRSDLDGVNGLRVDAARGVLWAATEADPRQAGFSRGDAGRSDLMKLDLASGKIVGRYSPPSGAEHGLNDIAVDASGRPFVTDTAAGQVYTLSPRGESLDAMFDAPPFDAPNGIAIDDAGLWLYVADSTGVYAVELATKTVRPLAHPAGVALGLFDGLYFVRKDGVASLVGVQTGLGPGRVVVLALSPGLDAVTGARVIESNHPAFDDPTTGAIVGGDIYVIANSQLGSSSKEEHETIVVRVPL